jgi:hypothetical protein
LKSYRDAELLGTTKKKYSCQPFYKKCPVSFYSLVALHGTGRHYENDDPEEFFGRSFNSSSTSK